ncbi:MAG: GNAT family N-acetyltransferase [Acidimicrobiales bacterium]
MGGPAPLIALRPGHDEAMLERAYRTLMVPAFPLEEELDDLATLRDSLGRDGFHIVVGGDVEAIGTYELLPVTGCGLVGYIAVDPAARGRGWARRMLERARADLAAAAERRGGSLQALFGEIRDPRRAGEESDSMAAADRADVMRRLGARLVLREYVQPELRAGGDRARGLMLVDFSGRLAFPVALLRAFLAEMFTSMGVTGVDTDSDFVAMVEALEQAAGEHDEVPTQVLA